MDFKDLTNYVLEMQGLIPNDAKVIFESYMNSECGMIEFSVDTAKFRDGKVVLGDEHVSSN